MTTSVGVEGVFIIVDNNKVIHMIIVIFHNL